MNLGELGLGHFHSDPGFRHEQIGTHARDLEVIGIDPGNVYVNTVDTNASEQFSLVWLLGKGNHVILPVVEGVSAKIPKMPSLLMIRMEVHRQQGKALNQRITAPDRGIDRPPVLVGPTFTEAYAFAGHMS